MFVVYYPVRFSYPLSRPPFLFVHFHVYDSLPLCTKQGLVRPLYPESILSNVSLLGSLLKRLEGISIWRHLSRNVLGVYG